MRFHVLNKLDDEVKGNINTRFLAFLFGCSVSQISIYKIPLHLFFFYFVHLKNGGPLSNEIFHISIREILIGKSLLASLWC